MVTHLSSPISIRLGYFYKNWKSQWFSYQNYTSILSREYQARNYLNNLFAYLKLPTSDFQINHIKQEIIYAYTMVYVPYSREEIDNIFFNIEPTIFNYNKSLASSSLDKIDAYSPTFLNHIMYMENSSISNDYYYPKLCKLNIANHLKLLYKSFFLYFLLTSSDFSFYNKLPINYLNIFSKKLSKKINKTNYLKKRNLINVSYSISNEKNNILLMILLSYIMILVSKKQEDSLYIFKLLLLKNNLVTKLYNNINIRFYINSIKMHQNLFSRRVIKRYNKNKFYKRLFDNESLNILKKRKMSLNNTSIKRLSQLKLNINIFGNKYMYLLSKRSKYSLTEHQKDYLLDFFSFYQLNLYRIFRIYLSLKKKKKKNVIKLNKFEKVSSKKIIMQLKKNSKYSRYGRLRYKKCLNKYKKIRSFYKKYILTNIDKSTSSVPKRRLISEYIQKIQKLIKVGSDKDILPIILDYQHPKSNVSSLKYKDSKQKINSLGNNQKRRNYDKSYYKKINNNQYNSRDFKERKKKN